MQLHFAVCFSIVLCLYVRLSQFARTKLSATSRSIFVLLPGVLLRLKMQIYVTEKLQEASKLRIHQKLSNCPNYPFILLVILTEICVLIWNQIVIILVLGAAKYTFPYSLKCMFSHRWYNNDLGFAFSSVTLLCLLSYLSLFIYCSFAFIALCLDLSFSWLLMAVSCLCTDLLSLFFSSQCGWSASISEWN